MQVGLEKVAQPHLEAQNLLEKFITLAVQDLDPRVIYDHQPTNDTGELGNKITSTLFCY